MPEPLPGKIDYSESVAKKMDKLFQLHEKVEPYVGDYFFENLFYLYLFKKYKMDCIITDTKSNYIMNVKLIITIPSHKSFTEDQNTSLRHMVSNLLMCIAQGKKIIIIPFVLTIEIEEKQYAHANLLIYRKNTSQLEHFEPHGWQFQGSFSEEINRTINKYLEKIVEEINKKIIDFNEEEQRESHFNHTKYEEIHPVTLVKAHDVCPVRSGLQSLEGSSVIPKNAAIEPGGYCAAWSMFFAELCLKNPEIPSSQIHEAILQKTELYNNQNDYLRNIIRGYTCFINNKIAKYFSQIYDEPMSTAKIHSIYKSRQTKDNPIEVDRFFIKLLSIMETELHKKYGHAPQPDVKRRYTEFTHAIRSKTSSSSLKSADRIPSPRRVSTQKASPKRVSAATTQKASPERAYANEEKSFLKDDKASIKQRIKEEKEKQRIRKATETQRVKDEKQRIKDEKAARKNYSIILEDIKDDENY